MTDWTEEEQPPIVAINVNDAEELVALAHATGLMTAKIELIQPGEIAELDGIRELRRIVLDTMADSAEYRSAT